MDEPMVTPGFEDVPGMEGFIPDPQVTGQGEFFSRSAGYLSFVDGSWSKEDLAREMGMDRHRDETPVTARDFPDKSLLEDMERQSAGGADLSEADDYKELIPRGLPRPFDSYHALRLHGGGGGWARAVTRLTPSWLLKGVRLVSNRVEGFE